MIFYKNLNKRTRFHNARSCAYQRKAVPLHPNLSKCQQTKTLMKKTLYSVKKFILSAAAMLTIFFVFPATASAQGQQFPDPGFEDWSGTQFDSKEQPKYWNYSNVEQMGVKKNFAHRTTGISGNALLIQDQFVGVMGIGATSPGYVMLGKPWAYVSSLTTIEDATAGGSGGISWTSRPDSVVLWIKRYYDSSVENAAGNHMADENFNIIYYAWSGTSRGTSYKAKNLSCTDISNAESVNWACVDEESDIRQALDGNECGTTVQAKQIAEGWHYEKKAYNNWTRLVVPIYYLNDDTPQKCNMILSAGNYPNFRANSGQYAGSSLVVDNISLKYTSKIQKLYVNGREWKAFDPDNTGEQTYSLGLGATQIPEIYAVRGAGSLTNNRGGKANFPGRRLKGSECVITYGQVDGAPTTLVVTSEDGSSTTTYRVKFVSQMSSNARLSDIKVNGQTISGFNPYLTNYQVSLPYGTTSAPIVEATPQDGSATVQITQPQSTTGSATILVTAGDGTTITYNLTFSVAALTDVTLRNIFIDGAPLAGFTPSKSNYTVSLPLGTTAAPEVTWESAYPAGVQQIQLLQNTLEGGAQIQVSVPDAPAPKVYKLTYKIEASAYSFLSDIKVDGTSISGFQPEQLSYTITLPMGTTTLPSVTWTQGDQWQTVSLAEGGVDGVTRIEVTAANGSTSTYRILFQTEKSANNALNAILLDNSPLAGFHSDTLTYNVVLPAGTSTLPSVSYEAGDTYQTVTVSVNHALLTARITVTAGNGDIRVYVLNFEVQKSENAFLKMIYLNGAELAGFDSATLEYNVPLATEEIPQVTVLSAEGQSIAITTPSGFGTAKIVVTPEEGTPNTYLVRFSSVDEPVLPAFPVDSFPASDNASLSALYIGGEALEGFASNIFSYTYSLPHHTMQVPAVVPIGAHFGQTITVKHGRVNAPTEVQVLAADGLTSQTYTVLFTTPRSSRTDLQTVEIEGASFVFNPAEYDYNISLPYGTTLTPSFSIERGEPEQTVLLTEAPLRNPSTIVVTAEDGSQATYTFRFTITPPEKTNVLLGIVIDGIGELDMSAGPDFVIPLPYGTTSMDVVSYVKNYPEQEVQIISDGIYAPTIIKVKSLNPSEADMIYTITPQVMAYDPAMLLDIKIGGVSLPQFRPDRYNYVVSVETTPTVTYTAQTDADVTADESAKFAIYDVESGDFKHKYTVTFFYPGDFTFDADFENWLEYTNSDASNAKGKYPRGWNAPITAITSGDAGTYHPDENTAPVSSPKTHGSKAAELATVYLTTSAEAMPGFVSLSQPTVSVGKWLLGAYVIHSSLAFGDPVSFRNTPDKVMLDYNVKEYKNKANGWRFIYNANGMKQVNFAQSFSSVTSNKWYTVTRDITYGDDFIPMTLDILISAAPSDVLEDYYTNFGISRSTSKMYVDNLRFVYNSVLNGLTVNGQPASLSGTAFTATVDAEYVGEPSLLFSHAVKDQMPVVNWLEETNGVRTATIRNYGEDLSYTDYTLTVTRPKSAVTTCSYTLDGYDISVVKGSPYQTIAVTRNDTAYVLSVTAENGSTAVYYAAWENTAGTASQHLIESDYKPVGESTGRLADLQEVPQLTFTREYVLDSIALTAVDTAYFIHIIGSSADTNYTVLRSVSDNALLQSMAVNGQEMTSFYDQVYDYTLSLASLDAFVAEAQDPDADVRYTVVPVDETHSAIFVLVTAPNGVTQRRYSVLARIKPLLHDAYLTGITSDGTPLPEFSQSTFSYDINLPAGSSMPCLSATACTGADVQTVTEKNGSSGIVTFNVTSEDNATTAAYVVHINVMPSEVSTLSGLYAGDNAIAGFTSDLTTYSLELPYGTTQLPEVTYVLTDRNSKAVVNVDETSRTATVTVTAEDNTHVTVYTVTFTIAKSTNADLSSIMLDGEPLSSFFYDEYDYSVRLPYGTPVPVITAEAADPVASVEIADSVITVTSEDGQHTSVYTLHFSYAPSENALLASLLLNAIEMTDYDANTFEYTVSVKAGNSVPDVTWLTGDDQQHVDTVWTDDNVVLTVTAGDGVTTAEYTLTFVYLLSDNNALRDLQTGGTTIEGFHPDTVEYTINYPVGSSEEDMLGEGDIVALPDDADAQVTVSSDGTTLQIFVTAPDGSIRVYVINQKILLSSEARLQMIWLGGVEVRDFNSDTLEYIIVLPQGSILPEITAEPLDTLALVDNSATPEEVYDGDVLEEIVQEIDGIAQDGTVKTYVLHFRYANWAPSGTVTIEDCMFFPIGGGQYKAVTIGIGVQLCVYDLNGRRLLLENVPTADPMDVTVETDAEGKQHLKEVAGSAEGVVFDAARGETFFYVFFNSKTKRISKGGKFSTL